MQSFKPIIKLDFINTLTEYLKDKRLTPAGKSLISEYMSYTMRVPVNCSLVNNFLKDALQVAKGDNIISEMARNLAEFIDQNKTSWMLMSVCESILNSNKIYDKIYINTAAKIKEALTNEQTLNESELIDSIKAGSFTYALHVPAFNTILSSIYKERKIQEQDYSVTKPISLVERKNNNSIDFIVDNLIFNINKDNEITEGHMSDAFITANQVLKEYRTEDGNISISVKNHNFIISEQGVEYSFNDIKEFYEAAEVADIINVVYNSLTGVEKQELAGYLTAIRVLAENFNDIVEIDVCNIIENGNNRYVFVNGKESLVVDSANHNTFTKGNILDCLEALKQYTGKDFECYFETLVSEARRQKLEAEQQKVEEQLRKNKRSDYMNRIKALTEKYKDNPEKLALIADLSKQVDQLV